jgi:sarcosine oxidase, subunit gamma
MAELIRLADATMLAVRARADALAAVDAALGFALPRAANTFATHGDCIAAWLGPDEWLLIDPAADAAGWHSRLAAAVAGHAAAVVDVSGNRVRLALAGEGAADLLARGCSIDPALLGPGRCAGTVFARAQIVLLQHDASPCFTLLPRRSFTGHVLAWATAAQG